MAGNSGPTRNAFAHERGILIGCLLLDSILENFQTIYLLQRLSISLKLDLITFFDQKRSKNRLLVLYLEEETFLPLYLIKSSNLQYKGVVVLMNL